MREVNSKVENPSTIETRRAFDAAAPVYDSAYEALPGIRRMRSITSRLYLKYFPTGGRLLELNCGTGNDALSLAQQGFQVLATDLSPGMLDEVRKKIAAGGLSDKIETDQMSFDQLGKLRGRVFDGACSNLGGLNCTDDLKPVATGLGKVIRSGGYFIATLMPPFCLWESAAFLARFRWRQAFRRMTKGGVDADLHGGKVHTTYYAPRTFRVFFAEDFDHVRTIGLAIVTPPPNFARTATILGRNLRLLEHLDDLVAGIPPFTSMGDHYTIVLRRK
jgi:ubiquinone/menaquinone biosynthesis C-methylase UbiE